MGSRHRSPVPLHWILVQRGIRQQDVAKFLGVSTSAMNKIVMGRQPCPPEHRRTIAGLLGLPEEELFGPVAS